MIINLTNINKEIVCGGMFNPGSKTKPSKSESHNTEPLTLNTEPSKSERLWIGDWLENGCREFANGWVYDAKRNKIGPQPYADSDMSPNAKAFRKKWVAPNPEPNE